MTCRAGNGDGSSATMPHPFSLPIGDSYLSDDVDLSGRAFPLVCFILGRSHLEARRHTHFRAADYT